jgi:serine/threonine-protein kinase
MSELDQDSELGTTDPQKPLRIGRFEIRRLLGEGRYGFVFLAFDSRLQRDVALKVAKTDVLTGEFREHYLREAQAIGKVQHPYVCPVYDSGVEGERPYIVMQYVEGGSLDKVLANQSRRPSAKTAVVLVRKLALGLHAAHMAGVIHRDLKPANILYDKAAQAVLITDFGLAKLLSASTSIPIPKGTPTYMSPEQWRPNCPHPVGPLSDVYSLGVILYQLLTGIPPFACPPDGNALALGLMVCEDRVRPPSAVWPVLDLRLDAICLKALAKNPTDRYPSAEAFAASLTNFLRDEKPLAQETDQPTAKPKDLGLVLTALVRGAVPTHEITGDLFELYEALNKYHLARGGSGLTVDQFRFLIGAPVGVGVQ